ncbi:MAG: TusE/DsrC/DsvC family sulfur relay protein [Woeseiaceae bacterium]
MAIEFNGRVLETDPEGYLENLGDWTPDVAEQLAREDDIELSANHWEVINFLRDYYQEYGITPRMRILVRAMSKKLGSDKGNSKYLYDLFPYGPAKQGCKYAGLPKPANCF